MNDVFQEAFLIIRKLTSTTKLMNTSVTTLMTAETHSPSSVFHKDSFSLQLHEQLTSTQVLQNQVQLPTSLECIDEVDDERMLFNNTNNTNYAVPLQQCR